MSDVFLKPEDVIHMEDGILMSESYKIISGVHKKNKYCCYDVVLVSRLLEAKKELKKKLCMLFCDEPCGSCFVCSQIELSFGEVEK